MEDETIVGKRPSGRSELMQARKASGMERCVEVDVAEAARRVVGRTKVDGCDERMRSGNWRGDADFG